MKNKFTIITSIAALFIAFSAQAQEAKEANFNKHKSAILNILTKEKAAVEASIACINSASKREDMKNCRTQKKSSMNAIREERKAMRKESMSRKREKLQGRLQKLDDRSEKNSSTQN